MTLSLHFCDWCPTQVLLSKEIFQAEFSAKQPCEIGPCASSTCKCRNQTHRYVYISHSKPNITLLQAPLRRWQVLCIYSAASTFSPLPISDSAHASSICVTVSFTSFFFLPARRRLLLKISVTPYFQETLCELEVWKRIAWSPSYWQELLTPTRVITTGRASNLQRGDFYRHLEKSSLYMVLLRL